MLNIVYDIKMCNGDVGQMKSEVRFVFQTEAYTFVLYSSITIFQITE